MWMLTRRSDNTPVMVNWRAVSYVEVMPTGGSNLVFDAATNGLIVNETVSIIGRLARLTFVDIVPSTKKGNNWNVQPWITVSVEDILSLTQGNGTIAPNGGMQIKLVNEDVIACAESVNSFLTRLDQHRITIPGVTG